MDEELELECLDPKAYKKSIRKRILNRYGESCIYCGSSDAETIDHIIPRSNRKLTSEADWNKFRCCAACNGAKGSHGWFTWYSQQEFFDLNSLAKLEEWVLIKE